MLNSLLVKSMIKKEIEIEGIPDTEARKEIGDHTGNTNNPHKVTKVQVGLEKVDNTSDVDKPVSTEQQKAIDSAKNNANEYTDQKIADLINGAPTTLDTLKEIADAMEENQDVVKALDESIGTKANASDLTDHASNTNNPHNVTAEQTPYDETKNVKDVIDEVSSDLDILENSVFYNEIPKNNKLETVSSIEYDFTDGILSAKGTASSVSVFTIYNPNEIISSDFIVSGCPSGGSENTYDIEVWDEINQKTYFDFGNGVIIPKGATITAISFVVRQGVTVDFTIVPKLVLKNELGKEVSDLNASLEQLKYSDIAGGKNLLNHNIIDSKIKNCSILFKDDTFYATNKGSYSHFVLSVPTLVGKSYTVTIKDWSDYSYRCIASVSDLNDNTLVSTVITDATLSMTFTAVGTESLINISPNNTPNEMYNTITFKCMLEKGSTATQYEPYYPSNKMLAENKADKSEVTTNLLKPTLETTTVNGVTCTNNGDGTYTLNGTASDAINISIGTAKTKIGTKYKIIGCPQGGNVAPNEGYKIYTYQNNYYYTDSGNGEEIVSSVEELNIQIQVNTGVSCNNLIFKPMLTTNLSATYDDFVPYTGTTGQLNSDVAELEKSNEGKMDKENPTGTGAFSMNRKADTTVGEKSTAEGNDCTASGNYSHAEGLETNATQERAHAEGYGTNASGYQAHTEGHWTVASGQSSHAEGESTLAQGYETHAEGNGTKAIGNFCHVEGHNTTALSDASHSEGSSTNRAPDSITSSSTNGDIISSWNSSKFSLAKGTHSHVEGCDCLALGDGSHAEGVRTKAVGDMSHSGGYSTEATGRSSCAIGEMVSARYDYQTAIGILNHNKEENIFEVGNGISDSTGIEKSNALELTRTGDLAIAGDFYFTDANGNKISMRDILTRLVALEPGFSVDVEG